MIELTDSALFNQLVERDEAAVLALYQRYGSLVYGLALQTLRQPGLAEEVTQDVFVKLWQRPERWNPTLGPLSSWLLTVTRNAAIDRLRREARHQAGDLHTTNEPGIPPTNTLDLAAWSDGQLLRELLQQLPQEQRVLIELAFFRGYTHSEISEGLDLPLGTVKTRLRTGMQKLRSLWEQATHDARDA